MFVPLVALFIGGFVAGRFASTYDQKLGALHGFVTWAIASLASVVAMACVLSMLVHGAAGFAAVYSPDVTVDPSLRAAELQHTADETGKILLGVSISMVLSLLAAIAGGVLAPRQLSRPRRRHNTAEVPVVPPPPEPPTDAPHVTSSELR
jgi:MFS family permease